MFCPNCGATLSDDAQFCGVCGLNIMPESEQQPMQANSWNTNDPAQNTAQDYSNGAGAAPDGAGANPAGAAVNSAVTAVKNAFSKIDKKILIAAGAAIVVVALIIVIIVVAVNNSGVGGISFEKVEHSSFSVNDDGSLALFVDGKAIKNDLDYDYYYYGYSSYLEKSNVLCYNDGIYKVDGDKLKEIREDVSFIEASMTTNAVAYVYDDELYLYKDGKETKIYDDAADLYDLCVSPNGNTVMFTIGYDDDFETYIYKGSKAEKFSDKYLAYYVSDDASVIYASKDGSGLSVIKNEKVDDAETIEKNIYSSNLILSKDNKSILYYADGKTWYYTTNLKDNEPIKVCEGNIELIFPENTMNALDDFTNFIAIEGSKIKRYILKGNDFDNYTIAKNVYSSNYCLLSDDGKKLIYMNGNELYAVSTTKEDAESVRLAKDAYGFYANSSLNKIYILTTDDELQFSDGKSKKAVKIDKDIRSFAVSSDGVCCYVDDDGVLYTTSGGSKGTKVAKMTDVEELGIDYGLVFMAWNDDNFYISSDGKNFEDTKIER